MKNVIVGFLIICGISLISFGILNQNNMAEQYETLEESAPLLMELKWEQDINSLTLLNYDEVVWRLNYNKREDKPFFYPLRTLNGVDLALLRPEDHPWHRGLWFSWKYINGVNYWEEDRERALSEGRSLIKDVVVKKEEDYSASICFIIEYAPEGKAPVLRENRKISISSPDVDGNYYIDWHQTFKTNGTHVVLDRTPPIRDGGPQYGGYAGLAIRANDDVLESIRIMDSNKWQNDQGLIGHGKKADWMAITGIASDSSNKSVGLAIFDHPSNSRYPSPWYVWFNSSKNSTINNYSHAFIQPAFLFDQPYEFEAGDSLSLKYRVMIHHETTKFNDFNEKYLEYIGGQ